MSEHVHTEFCEDSNRRFQLRRRMAKGSFMTILLITIGLFVVVGVGTEETRLNLSAISGILTTIVVALIGNIAHYSQLVYHDDTNNNGK